MTQVVKPSKKVTIDNVVWGAEVITDLPKKRRGRPRKEPVVTTKNNECVGGCGISPEHWCSKCKLPLCNMCVVNNEEAEEKTKRLCTVCS